MIQFSNAGMILCKHDIFRVRVSPMEHPKFNPCQAVSRQPVYRQRKHAVPKPGTFWSPGYRIIMDSHITTNIIYIAQHSHIQLLQYLYETCIRNIQCLTSFTEMCTWCDSHCVIMSCVYTVTYTAITKMSVINIFVFQAKYSWLLWNKSLFE